SYEYVHPGRYEVEFAATGVAAAGFSCHWTIEAPGGVTALRATGPRVIVRLAEGVYSVTAAIRLADGRSGAGRELIRVKDLLVVLPGDSLATGEGNPEKPACWEGAGLLGLGLGLLGVLLLRARGGIAGSGADPRKRGRGVTWALVAACGLLAAALFEVLVG